MKRRLLRSSSFVRAAKKLVKKHPQSALDIQSALELLTTDAFHPRLKTHQLKGDLQDSWACSHVGGISKLTWREVHGGFSKR